MAIIDELMRSAHLQKMIRLPLGRQYSLVAGMASVILLYSCYLWLWPEWQKQQILKADSSIAEQSLANAISIYQKLTINNQTANELHKIEEELSFFNQADINADRATETINHYLNLSGCRLLTLKSQPIKQNNSFVIYQWRLQLQGNYAQIVHFLTLFSENNDLFIPEAINISKHEQHLRLDLTLNLYQLNSL